MENKEGEDKLKHANFRIPMSTYKKFRLIAASEGISIQELYKKAVIDFVEKRMKP